MIIQEHEVKLINPERDFEWLEQFESKVRELPKSYSLHSIFDAVTRPNSVFFSIDNKGIIGVMNIRQGYFADAHLSFLEKPSKEIVEVCKEVADIIMACSDLQMLTTIIPVNRIGVIRFADKVGFVPVEKNNGILLLVKLRKEPSNGT